MEVWRNGVFPGKVLDEATKGNERMNRDKKEEEQDSRHNHDQLDQGLEMFARQPAEYKNSSIFLGGRVRGGRYADCRGRECI